MIWYRIYHLNDVNSAATGSDQHSVLTVLSYLSLHERPSYAGWKAVPGFLVIMKMSLLRSSQMDLLMKFIQLFVQADLSSFIWNGIELILC